jgi:hypothetical protein
VPLPANNAADELGFSITSSIKVFHSPHDEHFPTHLADSVPQLVQKKAVFTFAIY